MKRILYYIPNDTYDYPTLSCSITFTQITQSLMWICLFHKSMIRNTSQGTAIPPHTTCSTQMWVIHLIVDIKNHLPSILVHWPLYWYTCYLPLLQWYSDRCTDRNSSPDTPLNKNYQPRPGTPYGHQNKSLWSFTLFRS